MANKRIKGITIEIDGNTTNLTKSLESVNKVIQNSNSELKDLNKALKLDPKNTELLAQKQELLEKNIKASKERLNELKEAQRQMGDYNKLTDEQKESYRALSVEIAKSESAIKEMNKELSKTSGIDTTKLKEGLHAVGEKALEVSKKLVEISAAVGTALAGVVGAGVKSYAELEKAQKGAQKLFGDSFKTVEQNAATAYKSMGLSSTQYYDEVNKYAVGLKTALKGDSEAAAKLSNDILNAQADIVASTGADANAVSNAFSAVMRGNYTLLDNMRLGISGTKQGMEDVIKKVNEWNKEQGNATNYQMGNYADMQRALVDYVKMQGISGNASKELGSTISGSITQMKAAFDNFLNGSGSPEALSETILNTLKNISGAITKLAPSILKGITKLLKDVVPQIGQMLFDLIPDLLNTITEMLNELLSMLTSNTEGLKNAITTLINNVVLFITENLPTIINIILQTMIIVAQAIIESIPTLVPAIVDCVLAIVDTLINNIDLIIDAAIELIVALVEAMTDPNTLEKIIKAVPKIILAFTGAIIKNLPKIIQAGIKIVGALLSGIGKIIDELPSAIWDIIVGIYNGIVNSLFKVKEAATQIVDKIKGALSNFDPVQWGKDMINGLANGIKGAISKVGDAAKSVGNKIKEFLHFSKPDAGPLREYETWMPDFVKGLATTMRNSSGILADASLDMAKDMSTSVLANTSRALRGLKSGVDASINPTINPSVAYDMNYKLLANAIIEGLKNTDVVLDDRKVGAFVDKRVSEEVYS